MEALENSPIENHGSYPLKVAGSAAQVKCTSSNGHSMGREQEELEATVQLENHSIAAITERWLDDWQNCSAVVDGYKVFRRDRQARYIFGLTMVQKAETLNAVLGPAPSRSLWDNGVPRVAEQSQFSQLIFIAKVLQPSDHLCGLAPRGAMTKKDGKNNSEGLRDCL
ncbi:hypothetical protein BTVI_81008 [Pitangus sulphuratus]|nr:hypothetical protein BTVI_81008 [Pitangus sulphuratus]